MMILIADSGSTKTDWTLLHSPHPHSWDIVATFHTQGITPIHQTTDDIRQILAHELLPQLSTFSRASLVNSRALETPLLSQIQVFFYGSGCTPAHVPMMKRILAEVFPSEKNEIQSDLMAAARALCQHEEGIACILGTGANSCLYDGNGIVQNTPALGYILGDEGSGAVLGRRFLNALLRGRLPETLRQAFAEETGMDYGDIIARVYRQPLANRWLASLSTFIHSHIDVEGVRELVTENFRDFLRLQVAPYGRRDLPVGAVGSIAWFYRDELAQAAHTEGFVLGTVVRSPMDGLLKTLNETK